LPRRDWRVHNTGIVFEERLRNEEHTTSRVLGEFGWSPFLGYPLGH
jgi:hypothetical protein